ncbi:hypothetical protein A2U01_0096633, partial [Trifolium medium]|nr:hypothetical protein [Trifolium medium]
AWTEYRRADEVEYQAIMDRNEAVFYEQYGAHMRAQDEQRAAASASAAAGGFLRSSHMVSLAWMTPPVIFKTSWTLPL